jgi:hypothetical protein
MTVDGRRLLLVAAAVVAVIAVAAWLLIGRGDGDEDEGAPASAGVSLGKLKQIAATIPHPVYWAGSRSGTTYELTRTQDGRVYIRYLPLGTEPGSSRGDFLTIGTYPQDKAFSTLKATARKQGASTIRLGGGGLAFRDVNRPSSVYAAYPGSDYQIEVFDPSGAKALQLVRAGKVAPLVRPASRAASVQQLDALPATLGHPVYWAGARGGATYELTQTRSGRVFIRYLPPDARVGTSVGYLTVGTYPQQNAFANVKARAAKLQATTIKLARGGLAYIDTKRPTSAYLAYPDGKVQVEVYSPEAKETERLVTGGAIRPVG